MGAFCSWRSRVNSLHIRKDSTFVPPPQMARDLYHKGVRTGGQGTPEGDGWSHFGERRAFRTGSVTGEGSACLPVLQNQMQLGGRSGRGHRLQSPEGRSGGRHCPHSHLPVGPSPSRPEHSGLKRKSVLPASCPSLCVTVKLYVFDD